MKIVGLCGKMGHGKDAAASALVSCGWRKMAFADGVREALLKLDPIVVARHGPAGITSDTSYPVTWLNRLSKLVAEYGWDQAKKSEDVRQHLQRLGTEVCRNMISGDCWVNALSKKVEELDRENIFRSIETRVVVSDVRFANEGEWIKNQGGLLIWINRPGLESNSDASRHASEKMDVAKMADWKIENVGTLEDLHNKILGACGIITPSSEEALDGVI